MLILDAESKTPYYLSQIYLIECDNEYISDGWLNLSEVVIYPFEKINPVIQNEIKFLFNYHLDFDGEDLSFDYLCSKEVIGLLNNWGDNYKFFVNTLWKERQQEIMQVCIDYAETCLAFHRKYCPFCDGNHGDCSATYVWKARIVVAAELQNELYPNTANNIILKYQGVVSKNQRERIKTTIIRSSQINKVVKVLKDYFDDEKQLQKILRSQECHNSKLVFNDKGNRLADFFKQLYDSNYIVGNKKSLKEFIRTNFCYINSGVTKDFGNKYLSKLIEGNEITCKNPIAKVDEWK